MRQPGSATATKARDPAGPLLADEAGALAARPGSKPPSRGARVLPSRRNVRIRTDKSAAAYLRAGADVRATTDPGSLVHDGARPNPGRCPYMGACGHARTGLEPTPAT